MQKVYTGSYTMTVFRLKLKLAFCDSLPALLRTTISSVNFLGDWVTHLLLENIEIKKKKISTHHPAKFSSQASNFFANSKKNGLIGVLKNVNEKKIKVDSAKRTSSY